MPKTFRHKLEVSFAYLGQTQKGYLLGEKPAAGTISETDWRNKENTCPHRQGDVFSNKRFLTEKASSRER